MNYLKETMWGLNSAWDYLISIAILVGGLLLGKLIYYITRKILTKVAAKTTTKIDDLFVEKLQRPFIFGVIIFAFWIALERLMVEESVSKGFDLIYKFLVTINVTWFISAFTSGIIKEYLVPYTERDDNHLDGHIATAIRKVIFYLIWIIGLITAIHIVGINIKTLIAGLGIGGIAFALAAQDTIKNLFGGVTLFIDRPFRIGDRVIIDNIDGFVMDIGLRSLRIRTLDNRLITIPNYKVVDSTLENVTSEPSRRVKLNLGLTYSTTPDQMELALELLRQLPKSVNDISKEVDVSFMEYGDFNLQILFIYYIKKDRDIFKSRSKVNLEILKVFNANKLDFAFPTQTLHIKQ